MSMYENFSCCPTPNYGYDMQGCGSYENGYRCNERGSSIYVILVLFVLCSFVKRNSFID